MTKRSLATVVAAVTAAFFLSVPSTQAESNEGSTPALAMAQGHLAVGGLHTCAVLADQSLQCWGNNEQGQLGNNTVTSSTVPKTVPNLGPVKAVAAGNNHTCALLVDGTVSCWGLDGNGQVGDGSAYDGTQSSQLTLPLFRLKPTPVPNLTGVTAIAAGGFHTCAILTGGTVKCWGDDGIGQLGDGKPGDKSLMPMPVPNLSGVTALAMGEFHTCALLTAGSVKCWGHNGTGQLGDGTTTDRSVPTSVVGLPDPAGPTPNPVVAVTAGYAHTCVSLLDGTARCWGGNTFGQLGYTTPPSTPTRLPNKPDYMSPSTTPGTVKHNNTPPSIFNNPPDLVDQGGITAISAGQFHTCALLVTGTARCWGQNGRGQLGTDPNPFTPKLDDSTWTVDVAGVSGATAVSAGGFHTCAATGSTLRCWGYNFYGQLGSSAAQSAVPVVVTAITGAKDVAVGTGFACALIDADTPAKPYCWGDNSRGQLGGGDTGVTTATIRVPVTGVASASRIDAGNGHACVLPQGSMTPQCWGFNETGQIGDGTTTTRYGSVPVSGLANATRISAGGSLGTAERGHTCAVTSAGTVQCWGRNADGQLGDSTNTDRATPVTVQRDTDPAKGDDHVTLGDLGGAVEVTTGGFHSCALLADSTVWCWGAGISGQLGDGGTTTRFYGVHVQKDDSDPDHDNPLTGVTAIAAGGDYTCALLGTGRIQCWGGNGHGQLGIGSLAQKSYPTTVNGFTPAPAPNDLATTASVITAGDDHACAVRRDGALVCWGNSTDGQVGNGASGTDVTSPAEVYQMGPTSSDVPGFARPVVKAVSASRRNTCAVLTDTAVRCWGDNSTNQLGDGIGPFSVSPRNVALAGSL